MHPKFGTGGSGRLALPVPARPSNRAHAASRTHTYSPPVREHKHTHATLHPHPSNLHPPPRTPPPPLRPVTSRWIKLYSNYDNSSNFTIVPFSNLFLPACLWTKISLWVLEFFPEFEGNIYFGSFDCLAKILAIKLMGESLIKHVKRRYCGCSCLIGSLVFYRVV